MAFMTDHERSRAGETHDSEPAGESEQSAAKDLADGLELMLRAAKKAVRHVDPQNIESIGRKALDGLEALNKKRVDEIKSKARRTLDPRRIEEIAEEASKELLRVVERVAERVDSIVTRGTGPFSHAQGDDPGVEQSVPPKEPPTTQPSGTQHAEPGSEKRVRVADDN